MDWVGFELTTSDQAALPKEAAIGIELYCSNPTRSTSLGLYYVW
jgi:hypothetical protein